MNVAASLRRRRLLTSLASVAVVVGAVPLLAPTCGDPGEGWKTFSRTSLIIPMDACYQSQNDGVPATAGIKTSTAYLPTDCPQAQSPGDVIKAYGLVYQLIRNDIAVYWVIDNAKTQIDGVDLTVQYDGGFPVLFYDWSPENPPPASPPRAGNVIDYRGGPFVVDGSDFARASAVLQSYRATFSGVNVHVSNVAFRGYAKRTMAGGWNAGGAIAPKVALLDIGSTSNPTSPSGGYAKNSEPIIRGYLARAGLDFPGAGGVATPTGHGQIYDRLGIDDFLPTTPGDWTTTSLYRYGYQILWVPHWFAPGSCSNFSSQSACVASLYSTARNDPAITDKVLATIGSFVADGRDLFAECAGLGSFEGVASGADWSSAYEDGHATTHFHVTNGISINKSVAAAAYDLGSASSPLLQLGDYDFIPRTGAIQNFKPATGRSPASTHQADVKRLATDATDPTWDYFTYRPPATGRGTTVYLGGHVYSGYADTLTTGGALQLDPSSFQIGGTRLVLNTLFNLGATCTASGVACNTGQAGVCAQGTIVCQNGQPVCAPVATPTAEVCNGLDDDCDWEVDEGLETECYDLGLGHPTENVGLCRSGIRSCARAPDGTYAMTACTGQVLPAAEVCNALDDDCDGLTDEELVQACYEGPSSSIDPATGLPRPACQAGTQTCTLGSWGACQGQVLPRPEICTESGAAADDDCDGIVNNGCTCTNGQTRACYTGPAGTAGVGVCSAGVQTCAASAWGPCVGEVLPQAEDCATPADEDCDTLTPPCPECVAPASRSCYPGDPADLGRPGAQCSAGTQACAVDHWGDCLGFTLPSPIEACDAIDNDCDGIVDEEAICPARFVCEHGVCVPDACGVELPPPEGYVCDPGGDPDGVVSRGPCGSVAAGCPDGEVCRFGQCVAPCVDGQCAAGSFCGGGACVAGGCYATGCPSGQLCREGACVTDSCRGVLCPSGTFCREGDCVQACAFVSCFQGEKCGIDGFCEPDPCAGVTCSPGLRCRDGVCAANPCADAGCADGQVCAAGAGGAAVCVDDPCSGVVCPAGVCAGGQCFSTANPTGAGTAASGGAEGGCGCGSGPGVALPALLALLAAPFLRRRRSGGRGALVALLSAAALLGTACSGSEDFDPAACAETCGEQRCVDLATDPTHCGGCGDAFVCGGGQICVDSVCGPGSAVAPYVRTISPASGPRGAVAPVTVQISGERFAPGATVRIVSSTSSRTYATTFADAGRVTVDLDLSDADPATWQLRVVNPDRVISNAVAFDVVVPFPSITEVQPAVVTAGTSTAVLVVGSGLTSSSQCRIRSPTFPEVGLPSTLEAAGLRCTVDAAALVPGSYELWVVNEGSRASNVRTLAIVSQTPTLAAVSPSSGPENSTVTLAATGTGYDPSSRVLFDGCAGPNEPAGCPPSSVFVGTTFVNPTLLLAALTLPDCAGTACPHTIAVRNGAGTPTGTLPFTVAADQPDIAAFSPATAYQGDTPVTLSFTGASFLVPATIEVQPPGGAFTGPGSVPVAAGTSTTTSVTGTIDLVGQPEGSWLARVNFGNGIYSSAWPFRVLSNQAILRDFAASPAPERSGAQGTTKSAVTFEVANLRPPHASVRVRLRGPGGFERELTPSPAPSAPYLQLTVPGLSLADLETGTYAFTVRNPNGATESNALSFSVTPGLPTLSSVSPTSHPQSSPTPVVTVTLTGTNFAKPDANGNGGSVVHIMAPQLGIPDHAIPAADTTVTTRTQIQVRLDVRDGLPGAYDVQVWNPPLPTDASRTPQRSSALLDVFTIGP